MRTRACVLETYVRTDSTILYTKYSTLPNICRYFTRKGFEYLVYYIGYSLRGTTVSVATYPLTMRSIRGGTLGWNIEIYSTPTNQFDWSVSRAYVINIYIYREFGSLNTLESGSLRSPIIIFIIINFFMRVFSEYTEAVTTSLIPIDAILPEI